MNGMPINSAAEGVLSDMGGYRYGVFLLQLMDVPSWVRYLL
jgi:hypothetical protein